MRNVFLLPLRRGLAAGVFAVALTLAAKAGAAAPWNGALAIYKTITNDAPPEALVTNVARAFSGEYPAWSVLTNAVSSEALWQAFTNAPPLWRWGSDRDWRSGEIARVFHLEWADSPELDKVHAYVLAAADRDEWLWLHPTRPAESFAATRMEMTNRLALLQTPLLTNVLYLAPALSIAPGSNGRILQRHAQNIFHGTNSEKLEFELDSEVSKAFASIRLDGPNAAQAWTLSLLPTNAVATPFNVRFRFPGATEVIGTISNLLVGDVWLLAGSPIVTQTKPDMVAKTNSLAKMLQPETQIAGRLQSTVPLRRNDWTIIDGSAPALARALAEVWTNDSRVRQIPLGIIPISAGAAELSHWRNQSGAIEAKHVVTNVTAHWIYPPGSTNGTTYHTNDLFRGTLGPLLWPAGGGITITGVVWLHGEWTATQTPPDKTAGLRRQYSNELFHLINEWRETNGSPLQFIIGQARRPADLRRRSRGEDDPWWQIQMAQTDATNIPNVRVAALGEYFTAGDLNADYSSLAKNLWPWLADPDFKLPALIDRCVDTTGAAPALVLDFQPGLDTNQAGLFLIMTTTNRPFLASGVPASVLSAGGSQPISLILPGDKTNWANLAGLRIHHLGGLATTNLTGTNFLVPLPTFSREE